jgi:hypothetical protein
MTSTDNVPASEVAKRRITAAARRLGTVNPVAAIGGLIDRSFELPIDDPRYGQNQLSPGCFPIEHSFSEMSPAALRLDLEPLGPQASPHARAQEASREMRRLVQGAYGDPALRWFDERSEAWRGSTLHGGARFGAWFGMAVDPAGLQEAKVYYELAPNDLEALPPNLQHAARLAMESLPGLTPIFCSLACGRKRGAQRLYFFHRGDLRLLDLEPLLHRLGIGNQLPGLLAAVGVVLGGRFVLPSGSVILGLRDTQKGLELKLDVLVGGMADPPPQMYQLLNMVLAERPQALAEMRRWAAAMTPDDEPGPGRISVVSFRVQKQLATRCSIYLRPSGYSQVGRSEPGPGDGARLNMRPHPGQRRAAEAQDPFRL